MEVAPSGGFKFDMVKKIIQVKDSIPWVLCFMFYIDCYVQIHLLRVKAVQKFLNFPASHQLHTWTKPKPLALGSMWVGVTD